MSGKFESTFDQALSAVEEWQKSKPRRWFKIERHGGVYQVDLCEVGEMNIYGESIQLSEALSLALKAAVEGEKP